MAAVPAPTSAGIAWTCGDAPNAGLLTRQPQATFIEARRERLSGGARSPQAQTPPGQRRCSGVLCRRPRAREQHEVAAVVKLRLPRMRCTCVAAVAGEIWRARAISPSDRTPLRIRPRTSCSLEESLACLAWACDGIRSVRTCTIDWARPRWFQCRATSTTAQIPTTTASGPPGARQAALPSLDARASGRRNNASATT